MKKTVFFGMILLMTSCNHKYEVAKPVPFIVMEEMEELMLKTYLLEADMHLYEQSDTLDIEAYGQQEWQELMNRHHITTEIWQQNYRYYISRENLRDTLMKHLGDRLTEMEAAEAVNAKAKRDSLPTLPQPAARTVQLPVTN